MGRQTIRMKRSLAVNDPGERPIPKEILSLGAGVQSSTLCLLAQNGVIEPPDIAVFADTGCESKYTYEWLAYLKSIITKFPIITVAVGNLAEAALQTRTSKRNRVYSRRLIPFFTHEPGKIGRITTRGCTIEHKVKPLIRFQKEYADVRYGQQWIGVHSWIGISTDEATRQRDSQHDWLRHRYPLIEMGWSRKDCLQFWERQSMPQPPRSSCVFCPFHSKEEWHRIKTFDPEGWQFAVNFEADIRAQFETHRPTFRGEPALSKFGKTLLDIDFTNVDSSDPRSGFAGECIGMCGV